jgi:hypothetical protein
MSEVKAFQQYRTEEKAFEAAHPFDLLTAMDRPIFRDMTAQEKAGQMIVEFGSPARAVFVLLRIADERGLNDFDRQVMWVLEENI